MGIGEKQATNEEKVNLPTDVQNAETVLQEGSHSIDPTSELQPLKICPTFSAEDGESSASDNTTNELQHINFNDEHISITPQQFSFLDMLSMDSDYANDDETHYNNVSFNEDSNDLNFYELAENSNSGYIENREDGLNNEFNMSLYDSEESNNTCWDDQCIRMQYHNLPISEPYVQDNMYYAESIESIHTILFNALMLSFGLNGNLHFDFKDLPPNTAGNFDEVSMYEDGLTKISTESSYVKEGTPIYCELLTRKERERKVAKEIAEQKKVNELEQQNAIQETNIKKKVTKAKNNLNRQDATKDKSSKTVVVNAEVKQSMKRKRKSMPSVMDVQKGKNKNLGLRQFGSEIEDKEDAVRNKTIKMQTVKICNEKQLAPSERTVESRNVGSSKVNVVKFNPVHSFAYQINNLRQKNGIASNLLKQYVDMNKAKKNQPARVKKQKVHHDNYKNILVTACKISALLKEVPVASNECDDKLAELFNKFLKNIDVVLDVMDLLPHFVLAVKCVKDCSEFSSAVRSLAHEAYFRLHAIYNIPATDKFEPKYIISIKKTGKINSRKARDLMNDIVKWDNLS